MQVVTLSLFRFKGLANKAWAFSQMQFAHKHMAQLAGLEFYKLFGSGTGEGFTPWPNFGVYAIMSVWPSLEQAKEQIETASIFQRYRDHSVEHATVFMSAYSSRGVWDDKPPFEVNGLLKGHPAPEPIAVITRATIKKKSLLSFWREAPAISDATTREGDLLLKIGVGEIPWLHQVTFSIWSNHDAMVRFAYGGGCHALSAKAANENGWFEEALFARLAIVETQGHWEGELLEDKINFSGNDQIKPMAAE